MLGFYLCGFLFFVCLYFIFIHDYFMTRAPARKILRLVKNGDFSYERGGKDEGAGAKFTIRDKVTGKSSYIYFMHFQDVVVRGDLFWFNTQESTRLFNLVSRMVKKDEKVIATLEKAIEDHYLESKRNLAKITYKDR